MNKKHLLLIVLLAFFSVVVTSCTDVNSMVDDYNGLFTVASDNEQYTVDNISADEMLGEKYAVSYYTTLCLAAPSGGAGYSWIAEVKENANEDIEKGTTYTLGLEQTLSVYLLDSELSRWGSYKLTLSVTKINGEILKDTAMLYVY